jgi:histidyl-tRNA synthetase
MKVKDTKPKLNIDILVHPIGEDSIGEVMAITSELWTIDGLSAQFRHAGKIKMQDQIEFCLNNDVKYMIVVGQTEIANGTVNFKDIVKKTQTVVPRSELLEYVRALKTLMA